MIDATCTGEYDDHTCFGATISGGAGAVVNVMCNTPDELYSSYSCAESTISAGSGGTVNVSCHSQYSCYKATIDGRDAAELYLNDCTEYVTVHSVYSLESTVSYS